MEALSTFLKENAEGDMVCWRHQMAAAERFALGLAEVEMAILEAGLLPVITSYSIHYTKLYDSPPQPITTTLLLKSRSCCAVEIIC